MGVRREMKEDWRNLPFFHVSLGKGCRVSWITWHCTWIVLHFEGEGAWAVLSYGGSCLFPCMTYFCPLDLISVKCFRCEGAASVWHGCCSGWSVSSISPPTSSFTWDFPLRNPNPLLSVRWDQPKMPLARYVGLNRVPHSPLPNPCPPITSGRDLIWI